MRHRYDRNKMNFLIKISKTILNDYLSFKTIYNCLYSCLIHFDITKLRRKAKLRKQKKDKDLILKLR